jgi:prepilin-type N-terminal cleavage/methylation domain-containing protein
MKKHTGFTLIEVMVCVVILIIVSSLILPALTKARSVSRMAQCTSNLRQLGQAMVMYQAFEGRDTNGFPERITHLADSAHQYVSDYRLFLCPMDLSKGTSSALKPGNSKDDRAEWAERANSPPAWPWEDPIRTQQNCSYLYEFSTRICENYDDKDQWHSDYTTWASDFLVEWKSGGGVYDASSGAWYPNADPSPYNDGTGDTYMDINRVSSTSPSPSKMSRFGLRDPNDPTLHIITWQEAKFWQKEHGDICNTGLSGPNDSVGYPSTWFQNSISPDVMISFGFTDGAGNDVYAAPQRGYSGSWMPILRCFWHQTPQFVDNESYEEVLNLSMEGNTFVSAPGWEQTAWNQGRDGDAP